MLQCRLDAKKLRAKSGSNVSRYGQSAREKLDLILDTLSGPGKNISRLVKGNEYEKTIESGGEPVNIKLWRTFNGGIS